MKLWPYIDYRIQTDARISRTRRRYGYMNDYPLFATVLLSHIQQNVFGTWQQEQSVMVLELTLSTLLSAHEHFMWHVMNLRTKH